MSETTFRVLSFDPGNNLGFAVVEFDYPNFTKAKVLVVNTLDVDKYINHYFDDDLINNHAKVAIRGLAIGTNIGILGNKWEPDFICHETAFSAHGRKQFGNSIESFACLRECILSIKFGAINFDRDVKVCEINPNTVKYCLMDHRSSDKSEIKNAVIGNDEIDLTNIQCDDLEYLDQHSWDAIAIAYTFIKKKVMGVPKIEHPAPRKNPKKRKTVRP